MTYQSISKQCRINMKIHYLLVLSNLILTVYLDEATDQGKVIFSFFFQVIEHKSLQNHKLVFKKIQLILTTGLKP